MQALLSFDQAPPFAAPTRFFLTAPLFLVLAGFLLMFYGPDVFLSRWMPAALALTHLVTVGFMLIAMIGALVQILPVVAGASVAYPLRVGALVLAGLSLGGLLLAAAFLTSEKLLFEVAAGLLFVAGLLFLSVAGKALLGVPITSPTIFGLKLSLVGMTGTLALGGFLALALARGWALPLIDLTNAHAAWGFAAWGGVLLVAMSYVVVPMFQLTPAYRARPSWLLPPFLLILVLIFSGALWLEQAFLARLVESCTVLLGVAFVLNTLNLQSRRRRARSDAPYLYWKWGLWSALVALIMGLAAAIVPEWAEWPGWALLFGIFLVLGGFVSLITGMLYRIVPFLVWLHLQERGAAPNVGKILPDKRMHRQMLAHFLAVFLCLAAVFFPELFARPAGLILALSGAWLFRNLQVATRIYYQPVKDTKT